ncbi:GAD-like domain-containing protein [Rhizobium aegyptiacum]|uniref:GAD-like domain-containing protein n=1 Tax=Rhizobium aegyptiacum TaxID=1764550 RepID=UPI0007E5B715|nr:GAD-like domain-containing protein [Rhizobium aegyptiacum]
MIAEEFLEARGKPHEARRLSEAEAEGAVGRVPEELREFWLQYGVGYYAERNYWLCTPALFENFFRQILVDVPELRADELAAIGYSSLGTVDLWHRAGRHFTFSLDVALLVDLTSRTRTDPPPHDLKEIYRAAGVDMPQNAVELFLEARSGPEDIWTILLAATSTDSYKAIYDDRGKALTPQLRRSLGELSQNEIYFRDGKAGGNMADHYQKLKITEACARVPDEIYYSFAVEVGGQQQIVSQTIPAGSVR